MRIESQSSIYRVLISVALVACALAGCTGSPTTQVNVSPLPAPTAALFTQAQRDAITQVTLFDGGPTIEQEHCCAAGPNGKTDRLSVRLNAFSHAGTIEAMRVQVESGQDCGGRVTDRSTPLPTTVQAAWEPYDDQPHDYIFPVPQERMRIIAQFRDSQGNIFPSPPGCDDAVGLGLAL